MSRFIEGAKLCLYLATIALVVLLSGLVWSAHKAIVAMQADVHAVATSAQAVSAKTTLDLEEAHRLILEAGLTAAEARKASVEERAYLGKWNDGLDRTLDSANSTLLKLGNAADGLTTSQAAIAAQTVSTLQEAQAEIKGLQPVEANLNASAADLDALLKAPDLLATMHNLNTTTAEFAQTSTDFQNKFHAILFPPPCQGKWCWLIKAWPYLKDAGEMAEPFYFGVEAAKAITGR